MGDTDMFGVAMNYLDEILEEGEEVGSIDALLSSFQHTKELVYSKKEEPVAAPGPPRSMREEQDRKDAIRKMVGTIWATGSRSDIAVMEISEKPKPANPRTMAATNIAPQPRASLPQSEPPEKMKSSPMPRVRAVAVGKPSTAVAKL